MPRPTDGLILFSHGSLLCGAGCALQEHAERIRAHGEWPVVEVGYLNYSRPTFDEAVSRCVDAGVRRIIVVPYFLVAGKFVSSDLPRAIESARSRWPGVEFIIADVIAFDDRLIAAILDLAQRARGPNMWEDQAAREPGYCRASARCPLRDTPQCPMHAAVGLAGATR